MASRIAEAYVQIVPRIDGVATQLRGQLSGEMANAGAVAGDDLAKGVGTGFGAKIKSYIGPALIGAGALAAVGVTSFLKNSVGAASDFAEAGTAVGEVFGSASEEIQKFAEGGAKALGQSKTQVLDAAKQFGIYGKAAGLAGADNAKFSTELITLATDLASFNNTSVDEAILAIGSGLRGEAEPLRRFGVLLDDATLRAKALEMGLISSTKEALTPQNKVLASNAVIMEQTATQQGDFARTSEGLANQQRILDAEMGNLAITVGTTLLPIITSLAKFMNEAVIPAFTAIFGFIKENIPTIATFVGVLGTLLIAFNAVRIATAAWTAVQTVLNFVLAANPLGIIIVAVAALAAGIVFLATKTQFFQTVWKAVSSFVISAWKGVTSFLDSSFKSIGTWFSNLWTGAQKSFNSFITWIGTAVKKIGGFFEAVFSSIGGFFRSAINGWLSSFEAFINFFIRGINGMLGGLNTVLRGVKTATGGLINMVVPNIATVNLPRLAKGGYVDQATTAIIGEAGPEVVTPLKDFERMMGLDDRQAKTINYYAAPNQSLDSEQALFTAMKRGKVIAGW